MNGYLETASLTRILADGKPPSDLADWLEAITADAIAKGRTNIIQFPLKRRTANDTSDATDAA